MKSARYLRLFFFFLFVLIISCETQEPISITPGNIKFTWTERLPDGGRVKSSAEPKAVLVSIERAGGVGVHQLKKLLLYKFGQEYVSESLQLRVGSYRLVQFLVLDENDEIIYATPVDGSEHASLVDHPLPINFEVTESGNTQIDPEVLAISHDDDPESLGYAAFGFEVVNVQPELKLKELWVQGTDEAYKVKFFYIGNQLVETKGFSLHGISYGATEWTQTSSSTFQYNNEGKLISKTCRLSTFTYEYGSNGEVSRITRSGGPHSNIVIDFTYDAAGGIFASVQEGAMQRYEFEYELNSDGDVIRQKRFAINQNGRTLQYDIEFTFDTSLANPSLALESELDFDIFFHGISFNKHNVASQKVTVPGLFSCTTGMEYLTNETGLVTSAVSHDPNGCVNASYYDQWTFTYIYE